VAFAVYGRRKLEVLGKLPEKRREKGEGFLKSEIQTVDREKEEHDWKRNPKARIFHGGKFLSALTGMGSVQNVQSQWLVGDICYERGSSRFQKEASIREREVARPVTTE